MDAETPDLIEQWALKIQVKNIFEPIFRTVKTIIFVTQDKAVMEQEYFDALCRMYNITGYRAIIEHLPSLNPNCVRRGSKHMLDEQISGLKEKGII